MLLFTSCKSSWFVTFSWVDTHKNGAYDPEMQTWLKFLYNAPTHQVSSSYIESFISYHVDKQTKNTNRFCSAMLHWWRITHNRLITTQSYVWLIRVITTHISGSQCMDRVISGSNFVCVYVYESMLQKEKSFSYQYQTWWTCSARESLGMHRIWGQKIKRQSQMHYQHRYACKHDCLYFLVVWEHFPVTQLCNHSE